MAQPFSSGSPVIDALFSREFAVRQADQAAAEAAAARAIQRQQIQAQSDLARAQQQSTAQQNEFNNLFRMQSESERNALFKRQLDIDEKARIPRTDLETERRKAAIIDANAAANNDAQRANALLQINIDSAVAAAKKDLPWGAGNFGGVTAANLDDPTHPARKAINKLAFDKVRTQLLSEKGGALNSLIPDPDTFTFRPVQYDETGKAIALPIPSIAPTAGGGYDYMGNPINPAGLGPSAAPAVVPVPTTASSGGPGVGDMFKAALIGAMPSVFGATATPKKAPVAPQPSVRRAFGNSTVLLTPEDDATLARQLLAVPAEQRPAAYRAMVDQWLQSGRARIMAPPVTISPADALPNYNAYQ